jgi:D-cysteine desulfhydrase family pyridoxal phosphate-dependent enzyme
VTAPITFAPLSILPTPLDEAPRLSAELGVRLLIKRDDLTGFALGGNKTRKLDFLLRDAMEKGCDTIIATGGQQSNFCRIAAGACAKLGLRCVLVLGGSPPRRDSANVLLDKLFGAEVHFADSEDWTVLEADVTRRAEALGAKAYQLPVGGATPIGALAYVHAADELLQQLPQVPDWIVLADGSGGTHAGLLAGLPAGVRVLGIDVSRPPTPLSVIVPRLATKAAALAGRIEPAGAVLLADHCGPHYASITDEARDAVRLAARTEALILDPVYTGKALAGLIAAVNRSQVSGTVVFWHTGGAIALFADEFAGSM